MKNALKKLLNNKFFINTCVLILVFVLVDQFTKFFVIRFAIVPVYFNNTVAFSLPIPWFAPWILFSFFIFYSVVSHQLSKLAREVYLYTISNPLNHMAGILVISGALSNLFDRFLYQGKVLDFINLKVWPVFNFADSFIVIGLLLFLYKAYIKPSQS